MKKGIFTKNESNKLKKRIREYLKDNEIPESDLMKLIKPKARGKSSFWIEIADCLPLRSVRSIKNFC